MRRRKIKHLGKKRYSKNRSKGNIKAVGILVGVFVSIFTLINITKYIDEMYGEKDISKNTIEYYLNIADEVSINKAQLSWKELYAIDMVRYDKDLTGIKKHDVISLGKKFIKEVKDKEKKDSYKVKEFDVVLNEIGFNEDEKFKANKYLNELKDVALGKEKIANQKEKIEFVKNVSKIAKQTYEQHGILPSVTVGQAILESNWGQSGLSKDSNNIFGIKADKRWNGETVEVVTSENYNDKIVASFRKYNSIEESIKDHGLFISSNERYKNHGLFDGRHYSTQAQALEDAGYATKKNEKGEPIYADILTNVIRNYDLQLLDREVQTIK